MIAPTLACIDYLHIERDIRLMDAAKVDSYHIDIMDGHYVPNLCLNFDLVRQIRAVTNTPMDVHLMVTNPMDYVPVMAELGIERACTHADACADPGAFLDALHSHGIEAGFALSPGDDISAIEPYIDKLDYLLILFVKPGFSGQKFKREMLDVLRQLDRLRQVYKPALFFIADGGIGWNNIDAVREAGCDMAVAGVFAVFGQSMGLEAACRSFRKVAAGTCLEEV